MPKRTSCGIKGQSGFFMGYFDDFKLLNVTQVRNYGLSGAELIRTSHYYLGVIRGTLLINGNIETRPIVYLTPRNILTLNGWDSPAQCWRDNFYIECSGERVRRLFEAFDAEKKCRSFFVADPTPFLALLSEMRQIFAAHQASGEIDAGLCLEHFAALLERTLNSPGTGRLPRIEQAMESIIRAPGKKWDFKAEADKCGITLRHWNRLFTAAASVPPHKFVASCRLRLAKELLSSDRIPVKAVAAEVGFEGASEFSRFFKRMCGMTPGEFRKSRMH